MIYIYNTLSNKKEEFIPLEQGKVKMYVCGPTVYNYIHIGNARPLIVFDVVRRYLTYKGYVVEYIQNITDVEDKIINKAIEKGKTPKEISEEYTKEFFQDIKDLGIKEASFYPKVTDNIDDIILFIKGLEEKGLAYEVKGNVYYRTEKFLEYGKLSNQSLNDLKIGARVEVAENKENPLNFVLWKAAKKGEVSWQSPWGDGRPGWHIECSALVRKYLGDTIDIHGGGADLIFPHHENEIAQSESLTDKPLANYWMHNGYLTIDEQKMSKSINNIITVKDLLKQYNPDVLRFLLLTVHYRNPINFSKTLIENTINNLEKIKTTYFNLLNLIDISDKSLDVEDDISSYLDNLYRQFEKEMDDDFNTANVITIIFDLIKQGNIYIERKDLREKSIRSIINLLKTMLEVLGFEKLLIIKEKNFHDDIWIEELINERNLAKLNKEWNKADEIREQLNSRGIILEDTSKGVRWRKK
ncbi:MAG: cysteine--tRNA ligase [Vulcanibacillus sp.]